MAVGFEIRPLFSRRGRGPELTPSVPSGLSELTPRPGLGDVEFVFGLARRLARQAGVDRVTHDGAAAARSAADGTVDALLWVLGATDVAPSRLPRAGDLTGGLRADDALGVELVALENLRAVLAAGDLSAVGVVDEHYLRGAADAVSFARGWAAPFWWAPLPLPLRNGPQRDEIGRRTA